MAHAIPALSTLPKTLRDWRFSGHEPESTFPPDIWNPLEPLFDKQGLTLWKRDLDYRVVPPNDLPRCPDAFAYSLRTKYNEETPTSPRFELIKVVHCPARTKDNCQVLIQLIVKGDVSLNHLTALCRFATGPVAFCGTNHVVPVLREISFGDMVFAVFPLMNEGFDRPWHYDFREVVDAIEQVLEGVSFCHEYLVAHLDLDADNILINFIRGATQTLQLVAPENLKVTPFCSYFPVWYCINNLELAACYDMDSDPSSWRVTGLPTLGFKGKYDREIVLEMLSKEPYCPFRADVWQLGKVFEMCFGHLGDLSTQLNELINQMILEDPLSRPTTSEVLERIRGLHLQLSPQILEARVPRPPPQPRKSWSDEAESEHADE